MTSLPRHLASRKSLGAWYTPISMVRPLVQWAIRSPHDHVLDPAVGDGVFLAEVARLFRDSGREQGGYQLHGVDVNPEAVVAAAGAVADVLGPSDSPDVRVKDFFLLEPPSNLFGDLDCVDVVVGNPPYVRYQAFAGPTRMAALRQAERAGVQLSNLSSSWAPFVIHAISFLRPGGRMALVLPEELLHAAYASEVRRYLRRTFRLTAVVRFDEHIFPEAQERVVFLLAEGKNETPVGELRLVTVRKPDEIKDLRDLIKRSETFPPQSEPQKWEARFDDFASEILNRLVDSGFFVPLRAIGKAGIGYVTGANDFFVLSPSRVRQRRFPARFLKPTVTAARQVPGAIFAKEDFARLTERDEPCYLWTGGGAELPQVAAYISQGRARSIPNRYKCRVRDPWYVVPGVTQPDAFLTYMSGEIPRLVLNKVQATCSNTLLAVRLDEVVPSVHSAYVASFYNSATMLSAERIGRRYGGGVLKLEPSEADRLLVPNPELAKRLGQADALLNRMDALLRAKRFDDALAKIDTVLLRGCGLEDAKLQAIRASHVRRQDIRLRRPRKSSASVTPN